MHAIDSAAAAARTAIVIARARAGDERWCGPSLPAGERVIMETVVNRIAKGAAIVCIAAMAGGCHRRAANPTALAPEIATDSGGTRTPSLLSRGDKLLVMIDGDKRGTGTYDGFRVVLDPPLDTLPQSRVDSVRVRVGPAAREMYGLSYRMVGVLLLWLRRD